MKLIYGISHSYSLWFFLCVCGGAAVSHTWQRSSKPVQQTLIKSKPGGGWRRRAVKGEGTGEEHSRTRRGEGKKKDGLSFDNSQKKSKGTSAVDTYILTNIHTHTLTRKLTRTHRHTCRLKSHILAHGWRGVKGKEKKTGKAY